MKKLFLALLLSLVLVMPVSASTSIADSLALPEVPNFASYEFQFIRWGVSANTYQAVLVAPNYGKLYAYTTSTPNTFSIRPTVTTSNGMYMFDYDSTTNTWVNGRYTSSFAVVQENMVYSTVDLPFSSDPYGTPFFAQTPKIMTAFSEIQAWNLTKIITESLGVLAKFLIPSLVVYLAFRKAWSLLKTALSQS